MFFSRYLLNWMSVMQNIKVNRINLFHFLLLVRHDKHGYPRDFYKICHCTFKNTHHVRIFELHFIPYNTFF